MNDEKQDSALQTPLPDQPHPPVRFKDGPEDSQPEVDNPAAPAEQTESD